MWGTDTTKVVISSLRRRLRRSGSSSGSGSGGGLRSLDPSLFLGLQARGLGLGGCDLCVIGLGLKVQAVVLNSGNDLALANLIAFLDR